MLTLSALLISTALQIVVGSGSKSGSYLKFDKESLNLSGTTASENVTVCLKEKPDANVVVYYEAPNTRFSKCALNFSPNNWDQPQALSVVAVPYSNKSKGDRKVPIKFTAYAEDCGSKCHGLKQEFPTTRTPEACAQCRVQGDPHYKTFDQKKVLNYQGIGDFYLVKSDLMVVQARQGKCGKASCVHALAVRYGSASFVIDSNDPNPDVCVKTITTLDGVIISKSRSGKMTTINAAFNAGSSLKVDIHGSGSSRFMNVYIDLATHMKGKVNGLCGKYDGDASNDFTGADGQSYDAAAIFKQSDADKMGSSKTYGQSPLFKYGETWKVADGENMFKCKDKCSGAGTGSAPAVEFPVTECKVPAKPDCKNAPPVFFSSSSSSSSQSLSSTPPSVPATSQSVPPALPTSVPSVPSSTPFVPTIPGTGGVTETGQSAEFSSTPVSVPTQSLPNVPVTSSTPPQVVITPTPSVPSNPSQTPTNVPGVPAVPTVPLPSPPTTPPTTQPNLITCPTPIYLVPVPPGYGREKDIPRYVDEPRQPEFIDVPPPSEEESTKNKKWCSQKITPIDQCDEDITQYITSCETDIEGQVNPETACNMHREAYAAICAQCVLDKTKEAQEDVSKAARESVKKHCFGNVQCDNNCKQCGDRGCLECNDINAFEVQAGRCVPKQKINYDATCYPPAPIYRPIPANEIAPKGVNPSLLGNSTMDLYTNPKAEIVTQSIDNALAESPITDSSSVTPTTPSRGDSASNGIGGAMSMSQGSVNLSLVSILLAALIGAIVQL